MNDKLKPCPFCGGEAKEIEEDFMIGVKFYFIECSVCKATFLRGNFNKQEAIEAWNRRVNDGRIRN